MTQTTTDIVLEQSVTQTEAIRNLNRLRIYVSNRVFGDHSKQPASGPADLSLIGDADWETLLGKEFLDQFTPENTQQLFEQAEQELKNIKPLVIYLPVELPHIEISRLGQHLREDYGPKFLLDIKLDPTLIAGAAFVWGGVYRDYSLKQKISENREKILDTLREYIKH